MSNPITAVAQLGCSNGSFRLPTLVPPNQSFAQASPDGTSGDRQVPTTTAGQAIPYDSVVTPGWCIFWNEDPTNYAELGLQNAGTFLPFAKLLPAAGSFAEFYVADSAVLYWRSHTAACFVNHAILDR